MITGSPVYPALSPRQTNPLSLLISQAIEVGNSILSEVIGSTPSASPTTSSTPTSSTSTTPTLLSSSQSAPVSSSTFSPVLPSSTLASTVQRTAGSSTSQSTQSPVPTTATGLVGSSQSSSVSGANKPLIIGLSVAIVILAIVLLLTAMWYWRRLSRRRRAATSRLEQGETKIYPATDDCGLHATSDWQCNPPVPEPTLPILRSLTVRSSQYKPLTRVNGSASPRNPFLSPAEIQLAATASTSHHNSYVSQNSSEQDKISSERDSMLVSPMVPVEGPSDVPVEVEGDTGSLLEKDAPARSRAIWPSRTDSLKFDFGFGANDDARRSEPSSFKVPRRPVGERYH